MRTLVATPLSACRRLPLKLVADLTQQVLPPRDVVVAFDALGREAVHHAQNTAPLVRLDEDDLGRVGGGAEKVAHLRNHFDGIEHVERIETIAEENDEAMSGSKALRVLLCEVDHR